MKTGLFITGVMCLNQTENPIFNKNILNVWVIDFVVSKCVNSFPNAMNIPATYAKLTEAELSI